MTVITISRQYGSGGEEIVDLLCMILGYRQFGKTDIARAAAAAGLSEQEIIDYNEDNYKVKNFIDRLFKRPAKITPQVTKKDIPGTTSLAKIEISEEAALALEQRAIRTAYQADNIIIIGRGGQGLLKKLPHTLHVRIEADMEDRIQHIKSRLKHEKQDYYADIGTRRQAQDLIDEHDSASADYIRQYYNHNWDEIDLYDVVLNTSETGIDKAVKAIVEKVHHMQPVPVHG
jgi:CMP/dCMP kinase